MIKPWVCQYLFVCKLFYTFLKIIFTIYYLLRQDNGRWQYRELQNLSITFFPQISWIRLRDWHILTTGVLTYTSDSRFQVLHKEGSYDWILQIKYVQQRDAGEYDCQVSHFLIRIFYKKRISSQQNKKKIFYFLSIFQVSTSTGTISRKVNLSVVRPEAFILGGDEYHIDRGSQISLVCVIEKAPTPPQ